MKKTKNLDEELERAQVLNDTMRKSAMLLKALEDNPEYVPVSEDEKILEYIEKIKQKKFLFELFLAKKEASELVTNKSLETLKKYFTVENYEFHDNKNPSDIDIAEKNQAYDYYIEDNEVTISDVYDSLFKREVIDDLTDAISSLNDSNDPYPLLLHCEKYDETAFEDDDHLIEEFKKALANPIVRYARDAYKKYKDTIIFSQTEKNKYRIANYMECVYAAIKLYERSFNVIIDKSEIDTVFFPILEELYLDFNPYDFVEKYYKAINKYNAWREKDGDTLFWNHQLLINILKFSDLFIEQYCRPYRINKEIKLI